MAVDPLGSRREAAKTFGATHTFSSMEEAAGPHAEITGGRFGATEAKIDLFLFAMMNKELKGTIDGSQNPSKETPQLLSLSGPGR